ncbi:hypothetical protein GCM10009733_064370 [Nonomuraea maheshkhaliensis]|uniref:Uncharacterized protein n=1 Tax=Nonomuraea maheshkhaliensis TaxID=419590 RepID=A0ABN2FS39_9ACTN
MLPRNTGLLLQFAQRGAVRAVVVGFHVATRQEPAVQRTMVDHQHAAAVVDRGGARRHMERERTARGEIPSRDERVGQPGDAGFAGRHNAPSPEEVTGRRGRSQGA